MEKISNSILKKYYIFLPIYLSLKYILLMIDKKYSEKK